jgi:hypothetical protein
MRKRQDVDDLILASGIGPTAVAERAGISAVTLYGYRKGIHRKVQPAKVAALAQVLTDGDVEVMAKAIEAARRK